MAEIIRKAVNKFTKGLIMDFSPENTKNDTLTHALNATLLTFNGNELSLQNDMGNARVETAYLPEGYIPVGTCEYGGIIYIVSYNPLEDKSQIGCFPSPERTVSNEELGEFNASIENSNFQNENGNLKNITQCVLLKKDSLNPGDKFVVTANESIYEEALQDLFKDGSPIENPRLALNVVSIEDSGKIVYLNSDIRDYTKSNYTYHILGSLEGTFGSDSKLDLDGYRSSISSGYSVFKSKTSGKLAILAELVMIDSYSVTHSIVKTNDEGVFDVIIHTEVEPVIDDTNYAIAPKLKYYYLKKSQGYLQKFDTDGGEYKALLFTDSDEEKLIGTSLGNIYEITTGEDLKLDDVILTEDNFNFPTVNTYHTPNSNNSFIPNVDNNYEYQDVKLATLRIPKIVIEKSLPDLPFKYDYTIVPCMDYGKLEHLAISNTVDFSKLHDFDKSDFTTWKYHIDGGQLRLTFGADIYDTFEINKVNGLFLEFYDLWGFAGSLEISNKKSYSGNYTKILPLNTLNAISKNKINADRTGVYSSYKRNINISIEDNIYKYQGKEVKYTEQGWKYSDDSELNDADNDCGTLYSNLLYGVKTYLRVVDASGSEQYIPKKDLFLFTLPIYNDLYYTISDFNTITNPQLEMVIAYKLEDSGGINVYESKDKLIDGYPVTDNTNIIKPYQSGTYSVNSFNTVKYYNYRGTSKLYLEVGLKSHYNEFNLYHSPNVNSYFKCDLQLVGNNDDKNYLEVKSDIDTEASSELLEYTNDISFNNSLGFLDLESSPKPAFALNNGIREYNFLNPENSNTNYIAINYDFVVGYKISVDDIKLTEIPATTFCALYHTDNTGKTNAEDFGIYITKDDQDENMLHYYSNAIFYNSGSESESIFGICRQVASSDILETQVKIIDKETIPNAYSKTLGQFNSGAPLERLVSYIGKLTFCQPHVHGLGDGYCVNVDNNSGIVNSVQPNSTYNNYYNLSLNTKNVIEYNNEFISSINHGLVTTNNSIYRKYTGITGEELEMFNKCLLNTMSCVYAYNPDYSTRNIYVGNVKIVDKKVQFTSNLISKNAKFAFPEQETFNDYIYIGNTQFSKYLKILSEHSGISTIESNKPIKQLHLMPNCTYCGSDGAYLISPLVYQTTAPQELAEEMSFQNNDNIIVRNFDSSIEMVKGNPNKKALYGKWGNSLLQLDVSNYSIDPENGELNTDKYRQVTNEFIEIPVGFQHVDEAPTKRTVMGEVNVVYSKDLNRLLRCTQQHTFNDGNSTYAVRFHNSLLVLSEQTLTFNTETKYVTSYDDSGTWYNFNSIGFSGKVNYKILDTTKVALETGERNLSKMTASELRQIVNGTNTEYYLPLPCNEEYHMYSAGYPREVKIDNQGGIIVCEIQFDNYRMDLVHTNLNKNKNLVINVPTSKTSDYAKRSAGIYSYVLTNYTVALAGTSLTLNDLIYEPNISGHRLYVKASNLWLPCYDYSGDIYYRKNGESITDKNLNKLSFYTGPCFR